MYLKNYFLLILVQNNELSIEAFHSGKVSEYDWASLVSHLGRETFFGKST